MLREFEKMMEETYHEFTRTAPEELVRERKLPDGRVVKEIGPVVYGYSITLGPDGRPVIREFGNIRREGRLPGGRRGLGLSDVREPLVDIIPGEDQIKVIVELPGINKEDINLTATNDTLTVNVVSGQRKYYKEITLPREVDADSATSTYNNGILEVTFKTTDKKPKGKSLKIE